MTAAEVAAVLGVSARTIQRAIADGSIATTRIGRRLRVPASELDRLTGERVTAA